IGAGLSGVLSPSLRLTGLVAQNNGSDPIGGGSVYGAGVQVSGRLFLESSTLSGNLLLGMPVDIAAKRRPRLFSTTCEHSTVRVEGTTPASPPATWSVCSLD